jgi:DNA-binding SARP family transcriptional activator/tetratricopeptide (TPR) repeat protein
MKKSSYTSSLPRAHLLGEFRITIDDNPILLSTRKSRALLAYLISCKERGAAVIDLSEMFWPTAFAREARHSLAQAVYHIRRMVGRDSITGSDRLLINVNAVTADLWDLEDFLANGSALNALRTYRPFLMGLEIDLPTFDAWRSKTDIDLLSRLTKLSRVSFGEADARGNTEVMEEICELMTGMVPDDPFFWDSWIMLLLKLGRQNEAEKVYVNSGTTLNELRPQWRVFLDASPRSIRTRCDSDSGFVGREKEIEQMFDALSEASNAKTAVVIVTGKAGIGKTWLCSEFCALAEKRQTHVVRAVGYEAEQHIPYNVLAELLTAGCRLADCTMLPPQLAATISELVPELGISNESVRTPLGPAAAQRRLFEAATRVFWQISERAPTIILIDDIHWADQTTLQWLSYFVRRTTDKRITIALASRPSERDAGSIGLVLQASNNCHTVELTGLTDNEATRMVRNALPVATSAEEVKRIVTLSGGHPLLLRELLRASFTDGPPGASEIDLGFIKNGLLSLQSGSRKMAEILAVIAVPTSVSRLCAIMKSDRDVLMEDARKLVDLCVEDGDGTLRFAHELIREAVVKTLSTEKLINLHRAIAQALESAGEGPDPLCYHFDKCKDRGKAYRYSLEAAAASELKRGTQEAQFYYQIALRNAPSERDALWIKGQMADGLMKGGEYELALPLLNELIHAHENDARAKLRWLSSRLVNEHAMKANSRSQRLLAEAREIETFALTVGDYQAEFHALRIQMILEIRLLDAHRDTETLSRMLTLSERNPVTDIGTDALRMAAAAMSFLGIQSAVNSIRTAVAWAEQLHDTELLIKCLRASGAVHYNCGRFVEAREAYKKAIAIVQSTGAILYMPYVVSAYASLLMEMDCDDEAQRLLESVLNSALLAEQSDYTTALCNLAILAYQRGMYLQCTSLAAAAFNDEVAGTWLEIALRGVWGLSLLELGSVIEAKNHAMHAERLLPRSNPYGDLSYGYLLIARTRALQGKTAEFIPVLRKAIQSRGESDPIGTNRLKLALADALIVTAPNEGLEILEDVGVFATSNGLRPLSELCDRIKRRYRRLRGKRF